MKVRMTSDMGRYKAGNVYGFVDSLAQRYIEQQIAEPVLERTTKTKLVDVPPKADPIGDFENGE